MRCKACDYDLWHCTGRICPECGEAFTLKDYEFEPETVQFHCPHCNFGTQGHGTNGWPDLTIEQCTSCGLAIGLDYYIVRPVAGHENVSLLPIRGTEGGWFSRYFRTVWLVMTKPGRTMGRIPIHEPLALAWGFFLTTVGITFAVAFIPTLFLFAIPQFSSGGFQGGPGVAGVGLLIGVQFVFGFVAMLIYVLYVLVWAVVSHIILKITGGCAFTFRRTMQGILYAGGASIVNIVPCIGGVAGTVWWIVSAINMVARGQRVSGGRATLAVLGSPVVLTLCLCSGYGLLLYAALTPVLTQARSIAQQQSQQTTPQTDSQEFIEEQPIVDL